MNRRPKNSFELEALEPRVLLSADAFLISAVAANALAHKPVEVQHNPAVGTMQDSLTHSAASEVTGIFEGISAQAIQSPAVSETAMTAHSGSQHQNTSGQNSESASQTEAQTAVFFSLFRLENFHGQPDWFGDAGDSFIKHDDATIDRVVEVSQRSSGKYDRIKSIFKSNSFFRFKLRKQLERRFFFLAGFKWHFFQPGGFASNHHQ